VGRGPENPDFGRYLAVHHVTNTRNNSVFMQIQTGTMRVQNLHRSSSCAAGVENPYQWKSDKRAPGLSLSSWHNPGCLRVPGPTQLRAHSHQESTTSVPMTPQHSTTESTTVSSSAGRLRWWMAQLMQIAGSLIDLLSH